jgi:subtilisin-like proprotein convertase family protein
MKKLFTLITFVFLFTGISLSGQTTFTNASNITISDAVPATPYPSTINVTGMGSAITNVTVTLNNMNHTFMGDVAIMLVAPNGDRLLLDGRCGGGSVWSGTTWTFSDAAATGLQTSGNPSGAYKPTATVINNNLAPIANDVIGEDPAPSGTQTFASRFNGDNPNGNWSLYVTDLAGGDIGNIAGGWSITITASNDQCAGAIGIPIPCGGTSATFSGNTSTATLDGPGTTCTAGSVAADVWYTVVGNGTNITATTCGSSYDDKLDIYTGGCGGLSSVTCNDDFCGLQSQVTWFATAGTTYWIRVHGYNSATGAYVLSLSSADVTAPTVTCPSNITANTAAGTCAATLTPASPTTSDVGCGVTVLTWAMTGATVASSPGTGINTVPATSFNRGVTTVIYTVADAANNTSTCGFLVTVTDNQNPTVVTCPSNITVNNAPGTCGATVTYTNPTFTDNCGLATTTQSFNFTGSTQTFTVPAGITSIIVKAWGAGGGGGGGDGRPGGSGGGGAYSSSTLSVIPGQVYTIYVGGPGQAGTGCVTGTGGGNGGFGYGTAGRGGNAGPSGCSGAGAGGGGGSAVLLGATPLVVAAGGGGGGGGGNDVNAGAGGGGGTNGASTSVGGGVFGASGSINGNNAANHGGDGGGGGGGGGGLNGGTAGSTPLGDQSAAGGGGGNNLGATINNGTTITPGNSGDPVLGGTLARGGTGSPGSSSGVAGTAGFVQISYINAVVLTAGLASGSTFPVGTTTNTFTATDPSGNTAICSFTVTVNDNQAPTITCPATQTLNLNASCQATIPNYTGLATANDNCPGFTVTQSPVVGTLVTGAGVQVVTLTVTQATGGLTATCNFNVNKTDVTAPTLVCPSNQTLVTAPGVCTASFTINDPITDNCTGSTWGYTLTGATTGTFTGIADGTNSPRTFNKGTTTVTLSGTDGTNSATGCSFTVTVNDNQAPTLVCPSNQILVTAPGVCTASFTINDPISDNCTGATWGYTLTGATTGTITGVADGSNNAQTFNKGTTTVTLSGTDGTNSATGCSFTVTVNDNQAPTLVCPSNQTLVTAPGVCTASFTINDPITDNCTGSTWGYTLTGATTGTFTGIADGTNSPRTFNKGTTTVTLSGTDGTNSATGCSFTVTVNDNQAPTLACPSNQTLVTAPGVCTASFTINDPITDNCTGSTWGYTLTGATTGTVTGVADGSNNAQTFNKGITTVTLSGTDGTNSATGCSFTVTVNDNQAPTLVCPSNQTLVTAPGVCTATFTINDPISDNCTGATWGYTLTGATIGTVSGIADGTNNTPTFNRGVTTVTLSGTDGTNSATGCSFTVTVNDNQVPTLSCPANQTFSTAPGLCTATFTIPDPITDNCTGATWSYSTTGVTTLSASGIADGTGSGSLTFNRGVTTVTVSGVDASGNPAVNCSFTITVNDNQPPTITCPANQSFAAVAGSCGRTRTYSLPTFSDNCPGVTMVQDPTDAFTSGDFFPVGITTIHYIATDASGNSSTCSFTITITDTQNPSITCPSAQTLPLNSSCQATLPDYTSLASANDNCPGYTVTQSPLPGTLVTGAGSLTVTLTVTQATAGASPVSCTFTVNKADVTNPVITCPATQTLVLGAACTATLPNYTAGTATDNCTAVGSIVYTQTPAAGSTVSGVGTTAVMITATDASGNSTNCTFNVNRVDNTAPTITCPGTQTLNLNATCTASLPDYTGFATLGAANCGATVVTQSPLPGTTVSGAGTTAVILTATDGSGNTSSCTFNVNRVDVTAPAITCPANVIVSNTAGTCGAIVTYSSPVITDNCSTPVSGSATFGFTGGMQTFVVPVGVTSLTVDAYGASAGGGAGGGRVQTTLAVSAGQTLNIFVGGQGSNCSNCPGGFNGGGNAGGTFGNEGSGGGASDIRIGGIALANRVVVAGGGGGNGGWAGAGGGAGGNTIANGGGTGQAGGGSGGGIGSGGTGGFGNGGPSGGNGSFGQGGNGGGFCYGGGGGGGGYYGGGGGGGDCDACCSDGGGGGGGSSFAGAGTSGTIHSAGVNSGSGQIILNWNGLSAGTINQTGGQSSGSTFPVGTTTNIFTATDGNGNTSTCSFTVTVNDTQAPTITCPASQTLNLGASCSTTLPDYRALAIKSDNCTPSGSITVTQSPAIGSTVSGTGTAVITLTATDASGNTSSCTFTVNKVDVTAPVITCPPTQTLALDAGCNATLPNYTSLASASDNCGSVTVTQSPVAGTTVSGTGSQTITLTASDGTNTTNCTFTLNKIDNTAPTITCPGAQTLNLGATCTGTIPNYTGLGITSDNCGGVTVTQSPAAGTTVSGIGTTTITLTATDASGNFASCNFSMNRVDNTPPTITCPGTQTLNLNASCAATLPDYTGFATLGGANCGPATVTQSPLPGTSVSGVGATVVTLTATDGSGNTATCTFNVNRVDVTAPVISCPANITVNNTPGACGAVVNYDVPSITDNCSSSITYNIGLANLANLTGSCGGGSVYGSGLVGFNWNDVGSGVVTSIQIQYSMGVECHTGATHLPLLNGVAKAPYAQTPNNCFCNGVNNMVSLNIPVTGYVIGGSNQFRINAFSFWGLIPNASIGGNYARVTVNYMNGSIAQTAGLPSGGVFPTGTTVNTFTVTDAAGNSSTCSFNVTVIDNEAPSVICPANIIVNNDPGTCGAVVNYSAPTGTDNCTLECSPVQIENFDTYTLGSVCGQSPQWMVWPGQTCGTVVNSPLVSSPHSILVAGPAVYGPTSNDFTYSLGNRTSGTWEVSFDMFVPTGTHANYNMQHILGVSWAHEVQFSSNGTGSVRRNGSQIPFSYPQNQWFVVRQTIDQTTNTTKLFINGLVVSTWPFATGSTGGAAPNQIGVLNFYAQNSGLVVDPNPSAIAQFNIDNISLCSQAPLQTAGLPSGSTFPVGTTTITYSVTDASGNVGSPCSFTVKVNDNEAPVPDVASLPTVTGSCSASVTAPTATDNCNGPISGTTSDPTSYTAQGTYTITWNYSDASGNITTQTQTVIVDDNTPPTFTSCTNIVVSNTPGACGKSVNYTLPFTDNCSGATLTQTDGTGFTSGNFFPIGTTVQSYTLTDAGGNTATCSFTVTVNDTELPVITSCPSNITLSNTPGQCSRIANWVAPTASDNCPGVTMTSNFAPGSTFPVGTTTVIYTATDAHANTTTCSFTVTINDTEAPVAICQPVTVVLNASGNGSTTAAAINNGSTDNCGITSMTLVPSAFTCANVGPNTVTLTVTDAAGNTNTCTTIVTVQDNTAPVANCAPYTLVLSTAGTGTVTPANVNSGSSDACGIATMTVTPSTFTCSNVGPNTVVLTVTDVNGNSSTCSTTITVQDNTLPTTVCSPYTLVLNASGSGTITASNVDGGSSDACGIASMTVSPSAFTCSNVGPNTVVLTVTDNSGNTSTCSATVTVQDNTAPTAICQNQTITLDVTGNASVTTAMINNGSSDACGISTMTINPSAFNCSNVGANTVILTVTDVNGNTSTCASIVTVVDNILPNANCQNVTVTLDASGNGSTTAAAVNNGSSDACGIVSMSLSQTSFTCANVGFVPVTLTVTDPSGNTATCSATVHVIDNTAPVAICSPFTLVLNASGTGTIIGANVNGGSTDACGIASLNVVPSSFNCSNVGSNTVVLTVTDVNGNTSTCSTTVTVVDNVSPVANCAPFTLVLDGSGNGTLTAANVNSGSSDACGIATMSVSPSSFNCSNVGPNAVVLTVTDVNGNISTCSTTVTVQDNTAPAIPVIATATGECSVTVTAPTTTDNCGTITGTTSSPLTYNTQGTYTIVWTFTDASGNTTTANQTVIVDDVTAPVPNVASLPTANGVCSVTLMAPQATDNCSGLITATPPIAVFTSGGTFTQTWTYDDGNGNTSTQTQTVIVASPEADILGNGNPIIHTSSAYSLTNHTDFGSVGVCSGTITRTYTIQNNGIGNLNLNGTPLVKVTGLNPGDFVVTSMPASVIPAGGSTTFTVKFNPSASGNRFARLTINNDDCNESGYYFQIRGTGSGSDVTAPVPTLSSLPNVTGSCSATVNTVPTANDACTGLITGTTLNSLTYSAQGTYTVVWSYNDGNGNISTQTQTVIVQDLTAPTAICQTATLQLDPTGNVTLPASMINNGSFDNCGTLNYIGIFGAVKVTNNTFNTNLSGWSVANGTVFQGTGGNPGGFAWINGSGALGTDPSIQQTFSDLIPGETYVIRGDFRSVSGPGSTPGQIAFGIDLDGTQIATKGLPNPITAWTPFSVTFTATSGTHTVRFRGEINGTDGDIALDNVRIDGTAKKYNCFTRGTNNVTLVVSDVYGNTSTCNTTVNILATVNPCPNSLDITDQVNESGEENTNNEEGEQTTSIDDANVFGGKIYPNPSNGVFNLELSVFPRGGATIKVVDALGQILYTSKITSQNTYYDFSYLRAATYYIQVITDEGSFTKQIIITHGY